VAFAPDGKTIASVGPDYRIQRWTRAGKPLGLTDAPEGILIAPITGLTFADNERVIAWLTAAQFAVAWEAPTGKRLSPEMDHAAGIRSIAFPAGKDPTTSGLDGRVFRWDWTTGRQSEWVPMRPARIPGQPMIAPVVNLSTDGTRGVWMRPPNTEVFDMATGDNLHVIPAPSTPPSTVHIATSPDGLKVVTVSHQGEGKRGGSCVIWDLASQQRVAEFEVAGSPNASAPGAVLSPDGSRLVLATGRSREGRQVLLLVSYDVKTGKKLAEVEDPAATGNIHLVVADDRWVVGTSTSGRVWAVDYVNGQVGQDIDNLPVRGESPLTGPVVFSEDGKHFATGVVGEQYTTYGVRVYSWPEKKIVHTFIGHAGPVSAVRFTPDGKAIASGAQDTSVLVWNLMPPAEEK
jgi:WD40 repeat protein